MLQVAYIREHKEAVIRGLAKRNMDATEMVNEAITLDEDRRHLQTKLDSTKAESNTLSKVIGNLFKSGEVQKANELKAQTSTLKETVKNLEQN